VWTSSRMGKMVTRWSDESNKIKQVQWDEQIVWLVDKSPTNDITSDSLLADRSTDVAQRLHKRIKKIMYFLSHRMWINYQSNIACSIWNRYIRFNSLWNKHGLRHVEKMNHFILCALRKYGRNIIKRYERK